MSFSYFSNLYRVFIIYYFYHPYQPIHIKNCTSLFVPLVPQWLCLTFLCTHPSSLSSILSPSSILGIIIHAPLTFPPFFSHKILSLDSTIGPCLRKRIHCGSLTPISADDSILVTARGVTTMSVFWPIEPQFWLRALLIFRPLLSGLFVPLDIVFLPRAVIFFSSFLQTFNFLPLLLPHTAR